MFLIIKKLKIKLHLMIIKSILFLTRLYKQNKNKITFIKLSNSGNNINAILKSNLFSELKNKYKIDLFFIKNYKGLLSFKTLSETYKFFKSINTAKLVITTHGNPFKNKKSIKLDLWHGFPLKSMLLMDKNERNKFPIKNIDYILSYSKLNTTLFNACFGITINNYIELGAPRNDFLFNSNGILNLNKLFNTDFSNFKIIFLFPTYRNRKNKNDGNYNYANIFGFKNFNYIEFDKFLEKNKLKFFLKIHPNDEKFVLTKLNNLSVKNIKIITEEILCKNNIDLYEVLNACSLLITDYSSIYFDYLLLNRPIIFNPVDLNEYKQKRGFLLEPYAFWTPGPKVLNQNDLIKEITLSLNNQKYYENERMLIRNLVFKYIDNKSTKRVIDFIIKLMK